MIKKFEQNDIEEIMNIWLKTNISAHAFIDKVHWENAYDMVKSLLPASDIFICQEEHTIKAFVGITDSVYIAGIFVGERYQAQGIGEELLDYCKERYPRLELDVFVENEGAVRFYQRNGFKSTRTQINPDFNRAEYHMVWSA